MRLVKSALIVAMLGSVALPPASAIALPLAPANGGVALVTQLDDAHSIVEVRYYRHGGGGAVAAGVIGGMILGGIIASQARPYYYDYPPAYYYPHPAYGAYAADPAIAYCMQRYRSYDPYSMTYQGYDGLRHPCP
jgi:hypothetical protein